MTDLRPIRLLSDFEWHHIDPVPVAARLKVGPADFPFVDSVTIHRDGESGYQTWLQYKWRLADNKWEKQG